MIRLETRDGTLYARVFIVDNDREIAVVLRRDSTHGQIIALETFTPKSLRRFKTEVTRWLRRRKLDDAGRVALLAELENVYEMFHAFREHGPDAAHGWAGSHRSRRLPEPHELAN